MISMKYLFFLLSILLITSCKKDDKEVEEPKENLNISYIYVGDAVLSLSGENEGISIDKLIEIRFDKAVNTSTTEANIKMVDAGSNEIDLTYTYFNDNKTVKLDHPVLEENASYQLDFFEGLKGANDEVFEATTYAFETIKQPLIVDSILIDGTKVNTAALIKDIDRTPEITICFNASVDVGDVNDHASFSSADLTNPTFTLSQVDEKTINFTVSESLEGYLKHSLSISSDIKDVVSRDFEGLDLNFYTEVDPTYKFPEISDDELLTLVQQQTFKYFWDLTNTNSGLMRERYRPTNPNTTNVTLGGSGFGVMSIIVGIERGFITRQEGVDRWETITNFLENNAATFHGAWPHWMNGNTGAVNKFSEQQDGADIIETSFMVQGLLTVRQYLDPDNAQEAAIIATINRLWEAVEWDFFQEEGEDALTWNWSPTYGYLPLKIKGWNEGLITYVLAASSPTHTISKEAYTAGWARDGGIMNTEGYTSYGFTIPLENNHYGLGGPLFFAHYSFLGLDPRNLEDQYANYWEQNVTHAKINHAYCADNPQNYVGYSDVCWGLTASDGTNGYSAHHPGNDRGVIAPTAAVASLPYTPEESMAAIKHFYYVLGDKIWGEYGFQDAFDFTNNWVDADNIGIDQGPQIIMIENYRTGLLWDLFMSAPEIQQGLDKLGFTY